MISRGLAALRTSSPFFLSTSILAVAALAVGNQNLVASEVQIVWPERNWATAPPESQGMDSQALAAAADYAQKYGGGSGCVLRHGLLVAEWGSPNYKADIKSCTKGAIGTSILGLAVNDGLVALDDRARVHYPRLGEELEENRTSGWLDEITVRHLATMTAGFDDGRPPRLIYRPGLDGFYSNDTSNMLAELLTLRYGQDLREVLRNRIMEPLGISEDQWSWRDNQYRAKTIAGLPSREFASGIRITHRALARIGYLYLRDGRWKDKQILSAEFVRLATAPTDLPRPFPGYALYWTSNAPGTFKEIPKDAAWALGLGDSFVLICPSLDLVVVRLGVGSKASQLPGKENWGGDRVARFFHLIVKAVRTPPYPPSHLIREIRWTTSEKIIRLAPGSDNWPLTWGDDDLLHAAYGDGRGFEPFVPRKLSLGYAKIAGSPPHVTGTNMVSPTGERHGDGPKGAKASGLVMIDGILWMLVRNVGNSQLAWSFDRGRTWQWSSWKYTTSFGCPTFLNFGPNYQGARDQYVYIYSPDTDTAYEPAVRMVLARVPKDRLLDQEAYEFFQGFDGKGQPQWTHDISARGAVFNHPGRCWRSGITYNAGIRRYLWCQTLLGADRDASKGLAIFEAAEPWGPWQTVFYADPWDVDAGETASIPTKWISEDGKTLHLVFSGDDAFNIRRGDLSLW